MYCIEYVCHVIVRAGNYTYDSLLYGPNIQVVFSLMHVLKESNERRYN